MTAGVGEAPSGAPRSTAQMRVFLGALSALGPASMGAYLPALPALSKDLGASTSLAQLSVGVFLIGLGSGQLIAGPLSDAAGRRRPMLAAIVVYGVAALGCALAPTIELFIASRLLQGVAASAGIVISRAIVRDLYTGREASHFLSRMVLIYGLAPLMAPLAGGAALTVTNWRGIFFGLVGLAVVMFVVTQRVLPETLPPERRQASGFGRTLAGFGSLLGDRPFLAYGFALGCGAGCIAANVAASSFVMQDVYGVSAVGYAAFFSSSGALMIITSQLNARLLKRYDPRPLLKAGSFSLCVFAISMLVGVEAGAGVWGLVVGLLGVTACWGFVPANLISLAMADHHRIAGSASAVLGIFQFGMAGLVAPLAGIGGSDTALPLAVVTVVLSLLSISSIAFFARRAQAPAARSA